jgi:SAM-dependent methyltransferase
MSKPKMKTYDEAYFDRWYRGKHASDDKALARKVAVAVAVAELHLGRPIRLVLDIGCGEAPWRKPLLKLRPGLHYQGVDASEYVVRRYVPASARCSSCVSDRQPIFWSAQMCCTMFRALN